ncbi:murein L,D-transpeptidase catalytic domain family protein [Stenotrophomonas pigmentata]|uniref:murein L,D-transpeptidase catalytic domain family protein n=1 Tax=Stenotrophomonas pigmentata TaxID=3055080 RepID=UPI0026F2AAB1|nr:murein L,D-transpeptidase catalytic domain family protein [Stenotrophomonas sp. 610A2]
MRLLAAALLALSLLPGLTFAIGAEDLVKAAPNLTYGVAQRALDAVECSITADQEIDKLIVVDMSQGAKSRRLWAFDLKDQAMPKMILNDRVAHGAGSDRAGTGIASKFSNTPNSHMTSLGLYKIAERYKGKNGFSRRLDGLLARWNSNARNRAVVMHPSNYVNENRVGRSQGCPAVNQQTMDALEAAGLSNAVLWIDGPEPQLAQEVADCAAKKRMRFEIERVKFETQFFTAMEYDGHGISASPIDIFNERVDTSFPVWSLDAPMPLIASMKMNVVMDCTSQEWSVDHWVQGVCPERNAFEAMVLPNTEPALQLGNGHTYKDRRFPDRVAATAWGPHA